MHYTSILKSTLSVFAVLFCPWLLSAQAILNEVSSTGGVEDFTGQDQDWIELYNPGPGIVDLNGYGLSDNPDELQKFVFGNVQMGVGEYLLVLASGSDNADKPELLVDGNDNWRYLVTNTNFPPYWEEPGFDDSNWMLGPGGFGYGDNDDATVVPTGTIAILMRQSFQVSDLDAIQGLDFYMDYDDGFIAYLNDVEIARSENLAGQNSGINAVPSFDHEASLYSGLAPELFTVDESVWTPLLLEGPNVLAIELHNTSEFSSDLSGTGFLIAKVDNDPVNNVNDLWWLEGSSTLACPFKLNKEGETLYFSDPTETILEEVEIPALQYQYSFSKQEDGSGDWCISDQPSPEASNGINPFCATQFVGIPTIETAAGFYDNQVLVEISHPDGGVEIRYTTNGDIPTANDNLYIGPFNLTITSVISARAFKADLLPSSVTKSTYFLNEDNQGMPTISISTNYENLWDNETGIYVLGDDYNQFYPFFGANFWEPWERVSYLEYFDANKTPAFELEMALEIHGGWSRAEDQRGLRIDTKQNLGGHIVYPLIPAKGDIVNWNNFNLRNGGQTYGNNRMQDAFIGRLVKDTHIDASGYAPVQVFLNGEYWGLYGIREKMDEAYIEVNHGYDSDNVNLIGPFQQLAGSPDEYQAIVDYAVNNNPASADFLPTISAEVDLENMTDYFATEIHIQNLDWNAIAWGENNLKLWKSNEEGSRWRFMLYDTDGALGNFGVNVWENYIELAINPSEFTYHSVLFGALLENTTYRNYFVNRYADLINTIYQPYQYEAVAQEIAGSIAPAMPRHIDRWGAPWSVGFWNNSVNQMLNYLEERIPYARAHIADQFNLPGYVNVTLEVNPPEAGRIKISTIYPDSNPWTGVYFKGVPVQITAIPNPGYSFVNWDPNDHLGSLTDAGHLLDLLNNDTYVANFTGQAVNADIIITEINYHSNEDYDCGDWVELYNRSGVPVSLADWLFKDAEFYHEYLIPIEATIPANGLVVLCSDLGKFQMIHPNVNNVYGGFNFGLNNAGESLQLLDHDQTPITYVEYDDEAPWATNPDGEGYTLELFDPSTNDFGPDSWVAECFLGTPGGLYNSDCVVNSGIQTPTIEGSYLTVSPNPAIDYILIENTKVLAGEKVTIQLLDVFGKSVLTQSFDTVSEIILDLPDLAAGVYFINWRQGDLMEVKRVVVR